MAPASIKDLRPDVPAELSSLVDQLLQKDPVDRPESASDVLLALERSRDADPAKTRVLFVDDEPDLECLIRHWFRRHVDGHRFELTFAHCGADALDVLETHRAPQLVFTDLRMPRMDGLQLLEKITDLDQDCVTVVVSAFGDMQNIRSAMNLGAFDFLTKPFDLGDLAATLEKAAKQLRTIRESARLRAENRLLDQHNSIVRKAFSQLLSGEERELTSILPLIERVRAAADRHVTLVSVDIRGFTRLADHLPAARWVAFANELAAEIVATVQRHRGEIVGFDGARLSISFGFLTSSTEDGEHAWACAGALRERISIWNERIEESGAPPVEAQLLVESGDITIDQDSGALTGDLPQRVARFFDTVSAKPTESVSILKTTQMHL